MTTEITCANCKSRLGVEYEPLPVTLPPFPVKCPVCGYINLGPRNAKVTKITVIEEMPVPPAPPLPIPIPLPPEIVYPPPPEVPIKVGVSEDEIARPAREKGWRDYVKWKDIREFLGDWKIRFRVLGVQIKISFNWARDLIAQGLAFILNIILNLLLFILGVVAVFIAVLIWAVVILLAPLLKPLFRLWGDLLKKRLEIDISDPDSVWKPLQQLLWGVIPKWASSMMEAIWKDVEKIYAEIPGALQALGDIRAYLTGTVFVVLLQHLGVLAPIMAPIKAVVQFAYDLIDWLHEKLKVLEEWIKEKLKEYWWIVSDLVESVFNELHYALDDLKFRYVEPIQDTINEIDLIVEMWIDEKTHIRPGLFKFALGRVFATVVNSLAEVYGVLDNLRNFLESLRARAEIEEQTREDNEDTLAVMFDSTLTNEELAKLQASPVMRDIDRTTKLIDRWVAGEKIPQGSDIDKTEEEISGTVG